MSPAPFQPSSGTAITEDAWLTYIESYRRDGFVKVPSVLTKEEAAHYYDICLRIRDVHKDNVGGKPVFTQNVNVWPDHDDIRSLTLHAGIAKIAEKLAGVPLRIWHDQILIKPPQNNAPTEFHQDQPYWPHGNSTRPISCWIALCDVPVEKGCMSFIPGQQHRSDLRAQDLLDNNSLMEMCPEMKWEPRVTHPLKAGDCTFHHGRAPHSANANMTDDPRVAHVMIYVDECTTYEKIDQAHPVTDPLPLKYGDVLPDDHFPKVSDIVSGKV